jgi:hypothetical protein
VQTLSSTECVPSASQQGAHTRDRQSVYAGRRGQDTILGAVVARVHVRREGVRQLVLLRAMCLAFSRLLNSSDAAAGCTTCEVGNILFKLFTQHMSECRFTCLGGYVLVGGDCVPTLTFLWVKKCVCLLLQDLVSSCLRGEGGRLEDMCYERRRGEACVDWAD